MANSTVIGVLFGIIITGVGALVTYMLRNRRKLLQELKVVAGEHLEVVKAYEADKIETTKAKLEQEQDAELAKIRQEAHDAATNTNFIDYLNSRIGKSPPKP